MTLNYHKRVDFRALDVFVDAVKNAPRDELQRAVKTSTEMSKDMIITASDRVIWKRLATLLRAELKGFAKKKNPTRKKNSKRSVSSNLSLIFRYGSSGLMFFNGHRFIRDKKKAIRFTTSQQASSFIEPVMDNESDNARGTSFYGVAPVSVTSAQIQKRIGNRFERRPRKKGKA